MPLAQDHAAAAAAGVLLGQVVHVVGRLTVVTGGPFNALTLEGRARSRNRTMRERDSLASQLRDYAAPTPYT